MTFPPTATVCIEGGERLGAGARDVGADPRGGCGVGLNLMVTLEKQRLDMIGNWYKMVELCCEVTIGYKPRRGLHPGRRLQTGGRALILPHPGLVYVENPHAGRTWQPRMAGRPHAARRLAPHRVSDAPPPPADQLHPLHRAPLPGEKDARLAPKLGQLQPFIAVFPQECIFWANLTPSSLQDEMKALETYPGAAAPLAAAIRRKNKASRPPRDRGNYPWGPRKNYF